MKDFLDHDIRVGDEICYPSSKGHNVVLTHGRVLAINPEWGQDHRCSGRKAALHVQPLKRFFDRDGDEHKAVWLRFPERCVVVKKAPKVKDTYGYDG